MIAFLRHNYYNNENVFEKFADRGLFRFIK